MLLWSRRKNRSVTVTSLLCKSPASVFTALWHWRCIPRESLILCLHPDGALLLAAEAAASHSCPAGGTMLFELKSGMYKRDHDLKMESVSLYVLLDLWWGDCSRADGRWLECFLFWWSWWSGEFKSASESSVCECSVWPSVFLPSDSTAPPSLWAAA